MVNSIRHAGFFTIFSTVSLKLNQQFKVHENAVTKLKYLPLLCSKHPNFIKTNSYAVIRY